MGTPYSIIDATNLNSKYHALNLGGWEGISPFPPLGYALVCKPPSFSQVIDPLDVDDWLLTIEKKLEIARTK